MRIDRSATPTRLTASDRIRLAAPITAPRAPRHWLFRKVTLLDVIVSPVIVVLIVELAKVIA